VRTFVLVGPTGVGKTALLHRIARDPRLSAPIEVVNADSMQVYRGMDVGTAKPAPSVRAELPHHLLDIRTPDQQYNLGAFFADAEAAIERIQSLGRIPVVSGGTAYYVKHLVCGLPEAPPSDRTVRDRLRGELETRGRQALRAELEEVDPAYAAGIASADTQRLLRGLEVYRVCGRALSSYRVPERPRSDRRFVIVGIDVGREELSAHIERRVRAMFERGLAEEVAELRAAGYGSDAPGMKGIGYREFFRAEEEAWDREQLIEQIVRSTRRYAKRQRTFFRKLPGITWYRPEQHEELIRCLMEPAASSAIE